MVDRSGRSHWSHVPRESRSKELGLHWWLRAGRSGPGVDRRGRHSVHVLMVHGYLNIGRLLREMTMLTSVWLWVWVVVEEGRLPHGLCVLVCGVHDVYSRLWYVSASRHFLREAVIKAHLLLLN